MDADEAVYLLRLLGLTLAVNDGRLDVSPADLLDDDTVWLLRTRKAAIIAELLDDGPRFAWRVRFGDGSARDTFHHPERTRAAVLAQYPDALDAEPLPRAMWPHDPNKGETP